MARQTYSEDQSLNSMTTRQLRGYIYDKSREAQARLDSIDLKSASKAYRDAAYFITDKRGNVRKSTSNMSKAEMVEYAYDLRQFNSLDTTSGFAKSIEWKENKQKYETFIRNRAAEGDDYWKQYITEKGNVSKKGYEDYKAYINFLKSVEDVKSEYGYRTLKQYAIDSLGARPQDKVAMKDISKMLNKIYLESKGQGFTQAQLIDRFELELERMTMEQQASFQPKKKAKVPTVKARKPKKSSSNIKTGKARKMKEHGKVRK